MFLRRQRMCSAPIFATGGNRPQVDRQRSPSGLVREIHICIPPLAAHTASHPEAPTRASQMHPRHSLVAVSRLVSNNLATLSRTIPLRPRDATVSSTAMAPTVSSQAHGLAPALALSQTIQDVLLNARKPSTRRSYCCKWERYTAYLTSHSITMSSIASILDFLIHLKDHGLGLSSLQVYLSAISAYHNHIDCSTVFSHPLSKQFLRGFHNLHPPTRIPPPVWDLPLVLRRLTGPPFEPMATCKLRRLAWKTAFLVAITSAHRVSELVALRRSPPYLVFLPHAVRLWPDIRFLPNIVSDFHMSADILLPDFFPQPVSATDRLLNTLDVKHVLLFYLDHTKFLGRASNLFVTYASHHQGQPVSSQRLSRWITALIDLAYHLER